MKDAMAEIVEVSGRVASSKLPELEEIKNRRASVNAGARESREPCDYALDTVVPA